MKTMVLLSKYSFCGFLLKFSPTVGGDSLNMNAYDFASNNVIQDQLNNN